MPAKPGVRGRLKVFLGYAPGVGKTYAMLEAAHQRRAEGVDVVVGCLSVQGCAETEALAVGLDTPAGSDAAALNIDAVLARQPDLVLVDELARANPPGARHAHRYQDVEELLAAGIDVYATLNIQHLESLKDIVAQITGSTVPITVPDRVLDQADNLELIDLPPEELLQRLHDGRICVSDLDSQTVRSFFRTGNLTALRELALRHAAARVDDQMRAYMQAHSIYRVWAATDRLLVCISPNVLSDRLVRTGRRLAAQLNVEWFVLYVETPHDAQLSYADRNRVTRSLRLAEELGAETAIYPGHSVPEAILEFARLNNITKIIVGKSLDRRWRDVLMGGQVADQLIRRSDEIDVYVISASADFSPPSRLLIWRRPHSWRPYLYGFGLVVLVSLAGQPIRATIEPTNLVMFYLLAVVVAAIRWGRGPSVLVALLSVLAFDFFMVPPRLTLAVSDAQYLLTFVGLFVVGLVISTLAVREREQIEASRRRERYTAALYTLSRDLARTVETKDILQAAIRHMGELFGCETGIYLAEGDLLELRACTVGFPLRPDGPQVANWVFRHGQIAGQGTNTLADTEARYLPLRTAQGILGVLAVRLPDQDQALTPEQERLLEALLSQIALAIEATQLAEKAQQAQLLHETERLQRALLNSISHDLRTPLASITGALSSLRDDARFLDEAARSDLVLTACEEADRLNRLVGNLLNMSRLEAGAMNMAQEECDIQDLVGVALNQMTNRLRGREVRVDVPGDLPPVLVDLVFTAQALVNLIDNALKYSPADTPVEITARPANGQVVIEVGDRGTGIPPDELDFVFEKFFRGSRQSDTSGTGLGLAISKGIVELHGGTVVARNRPGGGTLVSFTLPVAEVNV
jgi:two-component system sensor histidine kinase KdpD